MYQLIRFTSRCANSMDDTNDMDDPRLNIPEAGLILRFMGHDGEWLVIHTQYEQCVAPADFVDIELFTNLFPTPQ